MESENIVIKGTPKKNKIALIFLIAGISLVPLSLIVASWAYKEVDLYMYFGFGVSGWYPGWIKYDNSFIGFFFGEFFNFSCFYGYLLIVGIIAAVVGIIMKTSTEKCEITVTDNRIFGKLPHGKEVDIPLNQVTGLQSCSFDGVSVASIGNVSNFHCIENHEEVMKAISYLLANPPTANTASAQASNASTSGSSSSSNEAEQLKRFKDLLDSGIITQEEFDAKKKEILGL